VQGARWENRYRTTVVCVDHYENSVLSGRLYNPYLPNGEEFHSTIEFLKKAESLLDQIKSPQPFSENRVFWDAPEVRLKGMSNDEPKDGMLGTFLIRVIFRQNSSWQGNVSWQEGRKDASFRSVLELLLLIDSAITVARDEEQQKNAETQTSAFSYGLQPYEASSGPPNGEEVG